MRLPAILLIAFLPVCGCDIFVDDWGAEGAPCGGQEDCQKEFTCNPTGHVCEKAARFGDECHGPQECTGEFGVCACFPANGKCMCTRPCRDPGECNDIEACCALVDPAGLQGYCTRKEWTINEFSCLCNSQDTVCASGPCVEFEALLGKKICSRDCPDTCPGDTECSAPRNAQPEACGYPAWFGFGTACTGDPDCVSRFPRYPICPNGVHCTRACSNADPCPAGLQCDPPDDGVCIHQK
jgi:hypothetical protein